jgi:hypothetical protein
MEDWVAILVAFVNDDPTYRFGTTSIQEFKVLSSEGDIEIQEDTRWDKLLELSHIFAGN